MEDDLEIFSTSFDDLKMKRIFFFDFLYLNKFLKKCLSTDLTVNMKFSERN